MAYCEQSAIPDTFEDSMGGLDETYFDVGHDSLSRNPAHLHKQGVLKDALTAPHRYLSIGTQPDQEHVTLVDVDPGYWTWLRLVIMRSINCAVSMGCSPLKSEKYLEHVALLIRIGNTQAFAHQNGDQGLRDALQGLMLSWDSEISDEPVFPVQLRANLDSLARLMCLNATEQSILGLAVLIHAESVLKTAQCVFGTLQAHQVPRLVSMMLKIPLCDVEKALDPQGALARSDLLTLDYRDSGDLASRMDLIGGRFAGCMLKKHDSIFSVLAGLVELVKPAELCLNDYKYMADRLNTLTNILSNALDTRRVGVNILVWGLPGLGKSQLARVIAQSVGRSLVQITTQNAQNLAHSPMLRFKIYRMAQAMFDPKEAFILFDECEEVFDTHEGFNNDSNDNSTPQKSWIHETLESNRTPTIWVCNTITDLTAAQIRRFDVCLKMEAPSGALRQEMFSAIAGDSMSPELMATVVKNKHMTPATLSKTAMLVELLSREMLVDERDQLALQLINDKLIAVGEAVIKPPGKDAFTFRPEFVNTSMALDKIVVGLKKHRAGRFLLHGPAGTGKSAFGKWISEELGVPHMVFRGSALLGKYVGETEENIAEAFEQATRESAVLQIDEIDTFLNDRQTSKQGWQISMTNEMLTQIEAFEGMLVTTTNFFISIDDAAKRRFDLNLEFDYLRPEDGAQMFQETCKHFNLELDSGDGEDTIRAVRSIRNLTAGDFQQVIGHSRFFYPESTKDLLDRIIDATSIKKLGHTTKMGFLRAA